MDIPESTHNKYPMSRSVKGLRLCPTNNLTRQTISFMNESRRHETHESGDKLLAISYSSNKDELK